MYCVFIFNSANTSERQCTMIRKTNHMQKCTWNDVFDVLWFYIQPGQHQRTPVHNNWKNTLHADMHLKGRPRCIKFLYSIGPKPVRANAQWLENISHAEMHMKRRLRCIVFLYSTQPTPVNASAQWLKPKQIRCRHEFESRSSMYCDLCMCISTQQQRTPLWIWY